jgi:serine protease AprX
MKASRFSFRIFAIWISTLVLAASLFITPAITPASVHASAQTTDTASYLVQGNDMSQVSNLVLSHGGTVTSQLEIINAVGAQLTASQALALRQEPGVQAVYANSAVNMVADGNDDTGPTYDPQAGTSDVSPSTDYPDVVGANLAWDQQDIGKGVSVAILDTGLSLHQGLVRGVDGRRTRILAWKDYVDGKRIPFDPNGHGTHIAGIIANSQVGQDKEWNGIAPGANLVAIRVLDEKGQGTYETVIKGLQWILSNHKRYHIEVVNLSLVSPVQSAYWADPLNQAVMRVWAAGVTVVAAAGNGGPKPMSIGVPGNNPYVITVGAFTDNFTPDNWNDDYIAPFSAAGPTLDGFAKPDVVAPGAHMVSTMLPNSYIAKNHQANQVSNQYFSMAGTSQAAAVASGAAALIIAHNPSLSPNQVKFRLMVTAFPFIDPNTTNALYSMWQQGTGRINIPDAVFAKGIKGSANAGMNIESDLKGKTHYEGYTVYDKDTGTFHLRGDYSAWSGGYGTWSGGYGTWSGGYGTWSGGYGTWSGGYGTWSGGYGTWSGGYGTWSGGYGTWSGGYGTWSGGYGTWSGGYGTWSGGYGTWSGSEPWAGSTFSDASFVERFLSGKSLDSTTTSTSINQWVDEP